MKTILNITETFPPKAISVHDIIDKISPLYRKYKVVITTDYPLDHGYEHIEIEQISGSEFIRLMIFGFRFSVIGIYVKQYELSEEKE